MTQGNGMNMSRDAESGLVTYKLDQDSTRKLSNEVRIAHEEAKDLWEPLAYARSIMLAAENLPCFTEAFCDPERNRETLSDLGNLLSLCIKIIKQAEDKHNDLEFRLDQMTQYFVE